MKRLLLMPVHNLRFRQILPPYCRIRMLLSSLSAEGEDIEGLIDTVPKLESEIKSLTAVNGKAGISLTDATGRVKDDFTFLLDLAGRWKEIGQADIEEGTNRQSKILEDLAGEFLPEIYSNIYLRTYLIARAA